MAKISRIEQDTYWENLFRAGGETAPGIEAAAVPTGGKGILSSLKKGAKRFGPELIGWMLLEKYLSGRHESKLQNIQMEAARGQAEMATPESLYYQAALPQAQQEEEMARNALLTHLSGGVIGPTLARGEKLIGG